MPPSAKPDIRVTIIGDSRAERCTADCGSEWFSAKAFKEASRQAKARFGDRVQLDYFDLSTEKPPESPSDATSPGLPVPRLIINGALRISGQFDTRMLLDAIDAEIEMKRAAG